MCRCAKPYGSPVKINVKTVFNSAYPLTRYVSYLLESYSELYSANALFESVMKNPSANTGNSVIAIKYLIITVCESDKIINLKEKGMANKYSKARDELIDQNTIQSLYETPDKKVIYEFLRLSRNLIAHFDHEEKPIYFNTLEQINDHSVRGFPEGYLDIEYPLILKVLYNLYNELFKTSIEKPLNEIFELLKSEMLTSGETLQSMIDAFFCNNTHCVNETITLKDGIEEKLKNSEATFAFNEFIAKQKPKYSLDPFDDEDDTPNIRFSLDTYDDEEFDSLFDDSVTVSSPEENN